MSTQTIDIQGLKDDIYKKVDTIENKETLKAILTILNEDKKDKKYVPILKHMDKILEEDDNLLRRLAE